MEISLIFIIFYMAIVVIAWLMMIIHGIQVSFKFEKVLKQNIDDQEKFYEIKRLHYKQQLKNQKIIIYGLLGLLILGIFLYVIYYLLHIYAGIQ